MHLANMEDERAKLLDYVPAVEIVRGGTVESIHYAAVAVVDVSGRLVASLGNPQVITYMRSTAKPLQSLPLLESGAPAQFDLREKEIALVCASHSGTDMHVDIAQGILNKIGLSESDLKCGTHLPFDRVTTEELGRSGQEPMPIRHNCSGAWAYAKLADPASLPPERAAACGTAVRAMINHPELIAGEGRFDTHLMRAGQGQLMSKGGAEGFQGIGIFPGVLGPDGPAYGLAIKIADGSHVHRSVSIIALSVLHQIGLRFDKKDQDQELEPFQTYRVHNHRGLDVGEVRASFQLNFSDM
jgi:L-asparaginase II